MALPVKQLDLLIASSDFEALQTGAIQVAKEVQPYWKQEEVEVKVFTDGITNRLVGCYLPGHPEDIVLIRVYGEKTELFIDRNIEMRNMRLMNEAGLSPPLLGSFLNGICYGFTPGTVLDLEMVTDDKVSRNIAQTLARMHSIDIDPSNVSDIGKEKVRLRNDHKLVPKREPSLFRVLRRYLELMPKTSAFTDDVLEGKSQSQRFDSLVPSREQLAAEVDLLEKHLSELDSPVVFCHNDLLLKNIIRQEEPHTGVTFIDFEYADFNYQAFDIGNHFCEFAGVDSFEPSLYPDKAFQVKWLKNYLHYWHRVASPSTERLEDEVERLYVQVNKFALAAHLFWGIWALIQAEHSTIKFDFLGYAVQRLEEYYAKKHQFLSLQIRSSKKLNGHL